MSRTRLAPSGAFVSRCVRVTGVNFANLLANTTGEVSVTVAGAKVGDAVKWGPQSAALESGLCPAGGFVTATNTVTLRVANVTAGAIDPASLTAWVEVTKSN